MVYGGIEYQDVEQIISREEIFQVQLFETSCTTMRRRYVRQFIILSRRRVQTCTNVRGDFAVSNPRFFDR